MNATPELWQKTVDFHGHACPGLAIGYRLTLEAARFMGIPGRSHDEEIVCISETDACGIDAAQVLLGCSMGKGNLLLRLRGKNAMTFLHRPSARACRVVWADPEQDGSQGSYSNRPQNDSQSGTESGIQSDSENAPKNRSLGREEKMHLFLTAPSEICCKLSEVPFPDIPEAIISPSVSCASCGELTAEHMMRLIRGQKLCLECVPQFSRILW